MTDKREQDALVAFIGGTSRTLEQWLEFARRDDCLDKMVPSDLRALLGALSRALTRPASGDAVEAIVSFIRQQANIGANWGNASEVGSTKRAAFGGGSLALDRIADEIESGAYYSAKCVGCGDYIGHLDYAIDDNGETGCQACFTEDGGGNCFKQATLTTEAPAQTEAMALADALLERMRSARPTPNIMLHPSEFSTVLAALRQPASVEAEPVAWRNMSTAPDGRVTENVGCRGPSDWFFAQPDRAKYPRTMPDVMIVRRRAWPQEDGWEDPSRTTFGADYFKGWMPIETLTRIDAHLADQVQS